MSDSAVSIAIWAWICYIRFPQTPFERADMAARKNRDPELRKIGQRVKDLRRENGWTQDQLAAETKISKSFISEIENGESNPRGVMLVKLATALGASIDFLMTGKEPGSLREAQLEIPAELAELAEEEGWPFSHVKALVEFSGLIEARRRDSGPRRLSRSDWGDYYRSIAPHLSEEGDE